WQPGRIEAGSVSHETAAGMDLFPTVVELAGAKLPPGHRLDGVSLAAMLTEQRPLGERDLFWDYQKKQAVRRGNWKLVIGQEGPSSEPALYNLADDVEEQNNVAE